jgi:hypothetical protein
VAEEGADPVARPLAQHRVPVLAAADQQVRPVRERGREREVRDRARVPRRDERDRPVWNRHRADGEIVSVERVVRVRWAYVRDVRGQARRAAGPGGEKGEEGAGSKARVPDLPTTKRLTRNVSLAMYSFFHDYMCIVHYPELSIRPPAIHNGNVQSVHASHEASSYVSTSALQ